MNKVLLGFEVPTGEPYYVQLHHTVITGMSDLSGKSTTAEAILRRSESKALVFLTKRGEKTFSDANRIQPYYRERFDWEYVRGLLEASMRERLKFETPWIIRVCKQATSLKHVRQLLGSLLSREKLRDFDRNIYTLLAAYLDKVLPTLEEAKQQFTDKLELKQGINVMDLTPWYTNEAVQMLCIRGCMEYILEKENNTEVGLPEAWKLLPQSRNTPVKLYFEKFTREGATNNNFILLDAQDLGGVDKTVLRQVSIWILGKMMEANEVRRILKQTFKLEINVEDVQTLKLGHFIVANGIENTVKKIYVWPWDVPQNLAIDVAKGTLDPEVVKKWILEKQKLTAAKLEQSAVGNVALDKLRDLEERAVATNKRVDNLANTVDILDKKLTSAIEIYNDTLLKQSEKINALAPLTNIEGEATLRQVKWNINVEPQQLSYKLNTSTPEGKIMWLAKEDFLKKWRRGAEIQDELTKKGWGMEPIKVTKALDNLVNDGFIGKRRTDRAEYKLAEFVTIE
jgi:hypothetical protein